MLFVPCFDVNLYFNLKRWYLGSVTHNGMTPKTIRIDVVWKFSRYFSQTFVKERSSFLMSYLKVKIYFKSRLNFLLLIFFLKWCVLFLIFYEIVKMVSNVSYHIILVKTRKSDAPSHSAFRTDLLEANQSDTLPLILLWNKYQLTGSKVYNTIFERMTAGKCQVGFTQFIHLWASEPQIYEII